MVINDDDQMVTADRVPRIPYTARYMFLVFTSAELGSSDHSESQMLVPMEKHWVKMFRMKIKMTEIIPTALK